MEKSKQTILITGASGFVGCAVTKSLLLRGQSKLVLLVRDEQKQFRRSVKQILLSKFDKNNLRTLNFKEIDSVIHCAAHVHITNNRRDKDLAAFSDVNKVLTVELARQAAEAGVKRFLFVSTIKVNGERTPLGESFMSTDQFVPSDPYGLSKYEAEQGLLTIAKKTGMEVVIIRPPLVYGPDVRANFASMLKWVQKGIPLPFGEINNKRSLVALDNLVNFIIHCVDHPKAANEIFLISDDEDVSTTELIAKVSKALGKNNWLFPVPTSWVMFVAKLIGKRDEANRLFGSLQVDSSKARDLLGWQPVCTMDEQLKKTAEWYLAKKSF